MALKINLLNNKWDIEKEMAKKAIESIIEYH